MVRQSTARQRVLDTALKRFTSEGYFNTSINDIVKASGVSIGSIYHHFDDKESIAKALYDELVTRMASSLEEIVAKHSSTEAVCKAIIAWSFQLTEEEPDTMSFILYAKHREFLPKEPPICSTRPFEIMRSIVQQGMKRGEVREMDPLVAASILFGGALRLVQLRLDGMFTTPLPEVLEATCSASWRAIAQSNGVEPNQPN